MKRILFFLMIITSSLVSAQSVSVSVVDTHFYSDNYDFVVQVHGGASDSIFINGMMIPTPLFRGANYGTTYIITVGSAVDTLCVPNTPAFTMPELTFVSDSSFIFDVPPFPFFLDPFRIQLINDTLIDIYNIQTVPSSGRTMKISHGGSIKNVFIEHDLLPTGILFTNPYYIEDTVTIHDTIIVQLPVHDTTFVYQPLPHHLLDVIPSSAELGIAVGSGTFADSTTVEIAAIPIAGYHFTQWSDGITENPRHILVIDDISLTANFEPDDVSVTTVETDGTSVSSNGLDINVCGADGKKIRIFDAVGRQLSTIKCTAEMHTFRMPAAGVYLVQVGNSSAIKVVVKGH